jgi:hypothetical protein
MGIDDLKVNQKGKLKGKIRKIVPSGSIDM